MSVTPDQFAKAKAETLDIYERHARDWDAKRARSMYEAPWLERFLEGMPGGARLLDLGCGSGVPIAGYLLERGFRVVGVDTSKTMIELAEDRYPSGTWQVGDMRMLPELGIFQGIFSWDGFFHLSIDEQRQLLPELCKMVAFGGALMLTVGPGEGQATGTVGGQTVYHASLSGEEYITTLKSAGFGKVIYKAEDPASLGRSVLLATGKQG